MTRDDTGDPPAELVKIFETERYLRPQHLSFELAKDLYIECAESFCDGFKVDENNASTIDLIIQYLIHDDKFLAASKYNSFDKGLLLRGGVGTGKTILMKSLMKFLQYFNVDGVERMNNNTYNLHFATSNGIAGEYSMKGLQVFEDSPQIIYRPLVVDDLGTEPQVTYFGNQADVIAEMLYRRYERNVVTHATTNLDADALNERYGERIYSRMKLMFNDIRLPGNDRRQ